MTSEIDKTRVRRGCGWRRPGWRVMARRVLAGWVGGTGCMVLRAEEIRPPAALFRDPAFVREFVGSYGILSDVEPKVSADEQALLAKVAESFKNSRFKEAEAEVVRFIKEASAPTDPEKKPVEISPAMVFVLGNLYFQADRFDEAERAFKEAIRRFPRFRRAQVNLAFLYVSRNLFAKAMPHLQQAVELGETSHRVYGLLGYCHLTGKNALAAENAYRQAYLLAPTSKDWKMGLAQALMMQEKMAEAASLLGSLIEESPDDRQLWLQQANAFLALDEKMKAAENLEVLRLKGLADEATLTLLGNIYMDQGQPQLALFSYLAAIDKSERIDVERVLRAARVLSDYGHPEKAEEFVSAVRKKAGDSLAKADRVAMMLTEVRVNQAQGHRDHVGALLQQLTALAPADGEVLLEMGRYHDAQAREETDEAARALALAEAKTHYQLAAANEATAYAASLAYGQMLVRERRFVEAMPHLEKALHAKKSDSLDQYVSRVRRAAERQKAKQEREAEERREKAGPAGDSTGSKTEATTPKKP